jgi:hypothetical protein
VDEDGRLGLAFESSDPVVPAGEGRVEVEPAGTALGSDGAVMVSLAAVVPTDEGPATTDSGPTAGDRWGSKDGSADIEGDPSGPDPSRRDRDVPPFRDPELLAEVYESCDTFAEMTDAIGMDVTAETVRRYMIDYGIHQPNTYDTDDGGDAADAEAGDSPAVLADGIGLPDDVTVETLIETVQASNTLYEVERDPRDAREDALDMLRELPQLALVVGRLSTPHERDIAREDVVERLREASATAETT